MDIGEIIARREALYEKTGVWKKEWGPHFYDYIDYLGESHFKQFGKYVYMNPNYGKQAYESIERQKNREAQADQFVANLKQTVAAAEQEVDRQHKEAVLAGELAFRDELYNRITAAEAAATSDVENYLNYAYYSPRSRGVFVGNPDTEAMISNRLADYVTAEEYETLQELSEKHGSLGNLRALGQQGYFDPFINSMTRFIKEEELSENSVFLSI
jgi:hypothetical protein